MTETKVQQAGLCDCRSLVERYHSAFRRFSGNFGCDPGVIQPSTCRFKMPTTSEFKKSMSRNLTPRQSYNLDYEVAMEDGSQNLSTPRGARSPARP